MEPKTVLVFHHRLTRQVPVHKKIVVLGAGSWGMACAELLTRNDFPVTLWEFDESEFNKLKQNRAIPEKLTDFKLPIAVELTNDLNEAVAEKDLVVLAVPSQALRTVLKQLGPVNPETGWLNLAKGLETTSLARMSEVITQQLSPRPVRVATLSGPSHAEEVVRRLPTTVTVAGFPSEFVTEVQEIFSNSTFRVYAGDDLIGVELGGALKNIIAIAVGITDGLGLGDNTRGALLTRGLAEISRLGVAMGADLQTFAGLSGIGDLVTTCCSRHSRNRFVGEKLGKGEKLNDILKSMAMVAEGVQTTRSGKALSEKFNVEMPITVEVYQVLFENKSPSDAVGELMGRQLKAELWH